LPYGVHIHALFILFAVAFEFSKVDEKEEHDAGPNPAKEILRFHHQKGLVFVVHVLLLLLFGVELAPIDAEEQPDHINVGVESVDQVVKHWHDIVLFHHEACTHGEQTQNVDSVHNVEGRLAAQSASFVVVTAMSTTSQSYRVCSMVESEIVCRGSSRLL
jgi:hypothetical protein